MNPAFLITPKRGSRREYLVENLADKMTHEAIIATVSSDYKKGPVRHESVAIS